MKSTPTNQSGTASIGTLIQTSLKGFQGFVVRKSETSKIMNPFATKHKDRGEGSSGYRREESMKRESDPHTSHAKRKSAEGDGERQAKKPKKPKLGSIKSDERATSKGKSKEDEDYDFDDLAFFANSEGRTTGRNRKPRNLPGMVSWNDIKETRTSSAFTQAVNQHNGTTISVGLSCETLVSDEALASDGNSRTRYDSLGLDLSLPAVQAGLTGPMLPEATELYQDLRSRLGSRRSPRIIDDAGLPPQAPSPIASENMDQHFPDLSEMMASGTPEPNAERTSPGLDKGKGKEKEPIHPARSATSDGSEASEIPAQTEHVQDFLSGLKGPPFQGNEPSASKYSVQTVTPPTTATAFPTPKSTIRSASTTLHHGSTVKIRLWIIFNSNSFRQVRWREGTIKKKTLLTLIESISTRLGMVSASIKGLKCVLRTEGREISDTIARDDEDGFREMKTDFNKEIERVLALRGETGDHVFDIFLEPLKEMDFLGHGDLIDDGEGWI